MLNRNEQLILLLILKKQKISRKSQNFIRSLSFYSIMKNLEKKDLVYSNYENKIKYWYLTNFGKLIAVSLAKLFTTPKEYQNDKIILRWFFDRL